MAITNGYATLADLKARLGISDTVDDSTLEAVIEAASRAIDNETNRVFYTTTEARVFTATRSGWVDVDDLVSVTTLKTDEDGDRTYETTWAATDYDLMPDNRTPKWRIAVTPNGTKFFPAQRLGVEVTGAWGYADSIPAAIAEACLIMAIRLFKRKDTPFGVMGTPELGVARIPKVDMDVAQLIAPYKKRRL